ncbi:MAG: DUF2721 domain-containing protein [Opitutaceae bacterium]|jgi:hypothetical protein
METVLPSSFLPVIQLSITPVILLSGVSGLLITLTNRLGRIVDRTRALARDSQGAMGEGRAHIERQLEIMWQRAKLLRLAVTLAGSSMLLSCVLVVVIFLDATMHREFALELVAVFISSVLLLIAALAAFLRDIHVSLRALRLEVDRARGAQRV